MSRNHKKVVQIGLFLMLPGVLAQGFFSSLRADEYAAKERSNAAVGHYARARAMLVEALAEFEQGRKYARPDMLLDAEEWRLSLISRTEELNRLLDPRPRISREGVRFQANKQLIRRERDRTPTVLDGAQATNSFGEEQRKKDMQAARARLDKIQAEIEEKERVYEDEPEVEVVEKAAPAKATGKKSIQVKTPETKTEVKKEVAAAKANTVVEGEEEEVTTAPAKAEETLFGPATTTAKTEEKPAAAKTTINAKPAPLTEEQNDQVTKVIDDAIQERAKTIKANTPSGETDEMEDPE